MIVSIHASVKDATQSHGILTGTFNVSIHASVKDATVDRGSLDYNVEVSIHASVKDATSNSAKAFLNLLFQSTHL